MDRPSNRRFVCVLNHNLRADARSQSSCAGSAIGDNLKDLVSHTYATPSASPFVSPAVIQLQRRSPFCGSNFEGLSPTCACYSNGRRHPLRIYSMCPTSLQRHHGFRCGGLKLQDRKVVPRKATPVHQSLLHGGHKLGFREDNLQNAFSTARHTWKQRADVQCKCREQFHTNAYLRWSGVLLTAGPRSNDENWIFFVWNESGHDKVLNFHDVTYICPLALLGTPVLLGKTLCRNCYA